VAETFGGMMQRKNYPKKLKINEIMYGLHIVPHIEENEEEVVRGYHYPKEKQIYLLSKQTNQELFSTFIHEAIHGICTEYKIRLSHKKIYELEGPLAKLIDDNFIIKPRR
jgi:hypothetical protein